MAVYEPRFTSSGVTRKRTSASIPRMGRSNCRLSDHLSYLFSWFILIVVQYRGQGTPFSLHAETSNGAMKVLLPRDYVGPVVMSTHNGGYKTSNDVNRACRVVSEGPRERRLFFGDLSSYNAANWAGDDVNLTTKNGSVRLGFVGEPDDEDGEESKARDKSFWSKLFH